MVDERANPGPSAAGNGAAGNGAGSGSSGGSGAAGGANRNRNRNRNRSRTRGGQTSGSGGGNAVGGGSRGAGSGGASGSASGRNGGGQTARAGGGQSKSGGNQSSRRSGGSSNRNRGGAQSGSSRSAPRAVALAPEPLAPRIIEPGLGATEILPGEVTANRRHAVVLCALAAALPAVVVGVVIGLVVSLVVGVVALVVVEVVLGYALWRVAPAVALRQVGAVQLSERENPRLFNVTEGLCATFGLRMPDLYVVYDNVPNACALGRDAASGALVVTSGLLEVMGPIELEGVVAHELAHVKRDDNGVAVIGLALARFAGAGW